MAAPVSVIIPTLNAATALPGCFAALYEGVEEGIIREVLVSDGGSTDATAAVVDEVGARWITGPASRGGQLRRGVAASKGDHVLLVHADTQLAPGWADVVARHVMTGQAGYFGLAFDDRSTPARFVAGWANVRSRLFGLPYGDQALCLPRALYDAVGGVPDQPLMEDVALARALRGQLVRLDGVAVTSADKYRHQGWIKRGARNLWTLARYKAGVSPDTLAAAYRSGSN